MSRVFESEVGSDVRDIFEFAETLFPEAAIGDVLRLNEPWGRTSSRFLLKQADGWETISQRNKVVLTTNDTEQYTDAVKQFAELFNYCRERNVSVSIALKHSDLGLLALLDSAVDERVYEYRLGCIFGVRFIDAVLLECDDWQCTRLADQRTGYVCPFEVTVALVDTQTHPPMSLAARLATTIDTTLLARVETGRVFSPVRSCVFPEYRSLLAREDSGCVGGSSNMLVVGPKHGVEIVCRGDTTVCAPADSMILLRHGHWHNRQVHRASFDSSIRGAVGIADIEGPPDHWFARQGGTANLVPRLMHGAEVRQPLTHARLLEAALVFSPLELPLYVVLWIVDFLPGMHWTRLHIKVRWLEKIYASVRAVRDRSSVRAVRERRNE